MIIRDPSTEKGMGVNSEGQATVLAESRTEARHVAEEGNAFLIASDFGSSLTTNDFTNIFYIKNESTTKNLHIGYLRTCNEAAGKWRLIDAPTALGTTAITAKNMLSGDTTVLVATIQSFSASGTTFTDGTVIGQWIQSTGHSIQNFDGSYILKPLESFGLEFAPFATQSAGESEACVTLQTWIGD